MSKNTLRHILLVFHFHVKNAVLLPGLDILYEIIFIVFANIGKAEEFQTFHCVKQTIAIQCRFLIHLEKTR